MTDLDANLRGAVAYEQDVSLRAALDAVLDLHQRRDDGLGYGSREPGGYGHVPDVCGECGKIDEYAEKWPCPTVRAIAGKLGVEVDGG